MSTVDSRTTLIALNGMRSASADVARASERITTGLRINRAGDDPSGFARGMRLQTEISSFQGSASQKERLGIAGCGESGE